MRGALTPGAPHNPASGPLGLPSDAGDGGFERAAPAHAHRDDELVRVSYPVIEPQLGRDHVLTERPGAPSESLGAARDTHAHLRDPIMDRGNVGFRFLVAD